MSDIELIGIDVMLRIDGHVRQLTEVAALFQRDPYPGGHRFFLGLEGPKAERLLFDVDPGRFKPPTEDQARRVMSSLSILLLKVPRGGEVMLLNTIDYLLIEKGRVHVSGICSPILARGAA